MFRLAIFLLLLLPVTSTAEAAYQKSWLQPAVPFRIADNLYYVGSQDLASFLITTPDGDILINSNTPRSEPLIRASVEKLGFRMTDIRILLISHAHLDHTGGSADILRETGARYLVMDGDASVVASGGKDDFRFGSDPESQYPPAHVDRILHDRDTVTLGNVTLTAHLTAGHTRGCTTWTFATTIGGKPEQAVIVGSSSVLQSYRLTGNESYAGIAADYARTFRTLAALPCDIFLGSHASFFNLAEKQKRLLQGDAYAFVDPAGYARFVARSRSDFERALKKQQHGH